VVYMVAKCEVSSFNYSQIQKVGHATRSWPCFAFFSLVLFVCYVRAKFEVSSFNRSQDMAGDPKF